MVVRFSQLDDGLTLLGELPHVTAGGVVLRPQDSVTLDGGVDVLGNLVVLLEPENDIKNLTKITLLQTLTKLIQPSSGAEQWLAASS